jgi:hypothetical protein
MKTNYMFVAACAATLAAVFATQLPAATITLDAIQDTWISPTNTSSFRTTPRNGELLDVKSGSNSTSASTSSTRRYGLVEFDLSSVPDTIIGAKLQLYMLDGTSGSFNTGTNTAISRLAPLAAHIDEATMTFDIYGSRADAGAGDLALNSLGTFTFGGTGAVTTGVYIDSADGSPSDAALVEAQRNTAAKLVGFTLSPSTTSSGTWHQWSDHEHGFAARLVLTTVPEPAAILFAFMAALGTVILRIRRK